MVFFVFFCFGSMCLMLIADWLKQYCFLTTRILSHIDDNHNNHRDNSTIVNTRIQIITPLIIRLIPMIYIQKLLL